MSNNATTPPGDDELVQFIADYTVPAKVVVIEDDEGVRTMIGMMLARFDVSTVFASNGTDAVAAVRGGCPDLIIMDLHLPDMHYVELCRAIQRWCPNSPVVIFSGFIDNQSLVAITSIFDRPIWPISKPSDLGTARLQRIFQCLGIRAPLKTAQGTSQ